MQVIVLLAKYWMGSAVLIFNSKVIFTPSIFQASAINSENKKILKANPLFCIDSKVKFCGIAVGYFSNPNSVFELLFIFISHVRCAL